MTHIITRRDFLRKTGAAAIIATTGAPLFANQTVEKKSKVILIRNQSIVDKNGNVNQNIFGQMLDEATVKLFDTKTSDAAWKQIFKPADIVGIKSNTWKYLPTPPEVENTLKARLKSVGVKEENISIDDQGVLSNPVFQKATALINARAMRAHHWAGVSGCLKNYIMFTPEPSDLHPDSCVDLGSLFKLPIVKGKTRLHVLLMMTPQFNCLGPHHFDKEFIWQYKGILVGTDPVALDAVGLKIIEAKRRLYFKEDLPIRPAPKHIAAAEQKHGVGVADMKKIDLLKLGWNDGVLI
ncbi:MAG: DUF362 domain-containing protein [Ignavibacteriales bacterium]|nr:DUF362 domain-containing protein [Ignavibacteriales bacterium]